MDEKRTCKVKPAECIVEESPPRKVRYKFIISLAGQDNK